MIGFARHQDVEVPFVLIQGSREFIDHRPDGAKAVMDDEKTALHDLFAGAGMLTGPADYAKYPYWGYRPSKSYQRRFSYVDYDWQGHTARKIDNVLAFADYFKTGFAHPFARLVLVPGEPHLPHSLNAQIAWDTLKHFKRQQDRIVEID